MNTIKLIFKDISEEKSDMVAAILSNEIVEGFEYENNHFYAFFLEENFDEALISEILSPLSVAYDRELIAPQNWNEVWEQNFEPIIINHEVGVRAHFHPPVESLKYDIEITPKMSFGTGHHATTQLMLQYVCEQDVADKAVFDFGCGTGVLSILASLKHAASIVAIDNDEWSVENAQENCERNHCSNISISVNDIETIDSQFDTILANINLNILIQYKTHLKKLLKAGGTIILSGLLTSDKENILKQYDAIGFTFVSQKQQKEWIALEFTLTQIAQ